MRVVHREDGFVDLTKKAKLASAGSAREHVAQDLAADLVSLLSSGAEVELRSKEGEGVDRDRVRPGHIAVLVRKHKNAALIRDALDAVDIPAVINGAGSVFATDPAGEWLRLLEALERPTSPPGVRSAALTSFLGWSAERLASAD